MKLPEKIIRPYDLEDAFHVADRQYLNLVYYSK